MANRGFSSVQHLYLIFALSCVGFAPLTSWSRESCEGLFFSKANLAHTVLRLENGARIPDEIISNSNTKELAKALVDRIRQRDRAEKNTDANRNSDNSISPYRDTEVQLFFSTAVIRYLKEKGFLNIHQVRNKTPQAESRRKREDELIGLELPSNLSPDLQAKVNELRPKSANLSLTFPKFWGNTDLDDSAILKWGYGPFIAVMKNEVKGRATWTPSDSHGRRDKARSFDAPFRSDEQLSSDRSVESQRGGAFGDEAPTPPAKPYFEAQIWGPVGLSDVSHFLVPPNTPAETLIALKELGQPIYQYEEVLFWGRTIFRPSKRLF